MGEFENDDEDLGGYTPEELNELLQNMYPDVEQKSVAQLIAESPYSVVGDKPTHPEDIPSAHDYEVTLTFTSRDTKAQVEAFIEGVVGLMPNGTRSRVTTSGEVMNVEDLRQEHVRSKIRITVSGREIEGTLDGIFDSGLGSGISKTLVIDGKAWVMSFGVVELNI